MEFFKDYYYSSCAIFASREKAMQVMEKIGAVCFRNSLTEMAWETEDAIWAWKEWNETNLRGRMFHKIFIDRAYVTEEFYRTAIIPTLRHCIKEEELI